jgi:DNA-binding NarL/FixJ family response regulator
MKLLLVEDNSGVRHVIRSLVESVADEIQECADGAEAVALYSAKRPDVVVMDIEMKTMDGITASRHIMAADPSARVIIVTDYDQPDLREAAYQAGACGYIVKDNLLELVDRLKEEARLRSKSQEK